MLDLIESVSEGFPTYSSITHNLSSSSAHRAYMTEIVMKRTLNRKSSIHSSILTSICDKLVSKKKVESVHCLYSYITVCSLFLQMQSVIYDCSSTLSNFIYFSVLFMFQNVLNFYRNLNLFVWESASSWGLVLKRISKTSEAVLTVALTVV